MAKARKFEATMPDGTVAKRSSQSRVYTFMVASRDSYQEALMSAKQLRDVDRDNYAFYLRELDPATRRYSHSEAEFERMRDYVADCASAGDFQKKMMAKRVALVEEYNAKGAYDEWGAQGWCSRRDLAEKLAAQTRGQRHIAEVAICEARQVN